jgi:hypothetical protein
MILRTVRLNRLLLAADPSYTPQLFIERWTATYGAWTDKLVLHRWTKTDRDGNAIPVVPEKVQAMGILILDGEWEDVA